MKGTYRVPACMPAALKPLLATVLVLTAFGLAASSARANVPFKTISSGAPINDIYLGNDLSCQVKLSLDDVFSFYPPDTAPGDCGTFVGVNGVVYGPDFAEHDGSAASNGSWMPNTPVSQTNVTGSGSTSDPYRVATVADAGASGLRVEETTTYVAGEKFYTSQIKVINNSSSSINYRLYRAADCYLAGSDFGFGAVDTEGGVFCSENADNDPVGRLIGFKPGTDATSSASSYLEDFYDTVWDLTNGADYADLCECGVDQDNGAGLSWNQTVTGGGSITTTVRTFVDAGPDPFQGTTGVSTPPPSSPIDVGEGYASAQFQLTCNLPGSSPIPCDPQMVVFVDFSTGAVLNRARGEEAKARGERDRVDATDDGVAVFSGQPEVPPGESQTVTLDATAGGPQAFQAAIARIDSLEAEAQALLTQSQRSAADAEATRKQAKKLAKKSKKLKKKAKAAKKKAKKASGKKAKNLAKKSKKLKKKAKKAKKKAKRAKKEANRLDAQSQQQAAASAAKTAEANALRTPHAELVIENQRNGATETVQIGVQLP